MFLHIHSIHSAYTHTHKLLGPDATKLNHLEVMARLAYKLKQSQLDFLHEQYALRCGDKGSSRTRVCCGNSGVCQLAPTSIQTSGAPLVHRDDTLAGFPDSPIRARSTLTRRG